MSLYGLLNRIVLCLCSGSVTEIIHMYVIGFRKKWLVIVGCYH